MAQTEEKKTPAASGAEESDIKETKRSDDEVLDSFLNRVTDPRTKKHTDKDRRKRMIAVLLISAGVIIVLIGIIILLNNNPKPVESEDLFTEAWTIATVDEAGVHTVEVPLDDQGNPRQNGSGTLIDYAPSLISEIRVENASGSFAILAHTDEGAATVYRLEGYESFPLLTGAPDAVANDAGNMSFSTIASTGKDLAAFGLEDPRAVVRVAYTDGTSAIFRVGDDAAAQAGTYVTFGSADNVYLVSSEAVDGFFYTPVDFIDLEVTGAASSADNASFRRVTLTGTHYPQKIVLEPNDDDAVNYQYRMTSPSAGFADAVMSADIAGSVRDLRAEEVVAVNVDGSSADSFLAPYGLSGTCYAEVNAEYPDAAYRLRVSAPDSEGYVYLVNSGDPQIADRIVYKIQIGALGWATASLDMLAPDTILSVSRTAIKNLTLTAGKSKASIDVDTRTQTVGTTDGGSELVTTTEAYYNGKLLSDESFTILLQNLTETQNDGKSDAPATEKLLEVRYTYSTGRAADTLVIYNSEEKSCPVALNGTVIGSVKKSYADSLVENLNDVIAGKTPKSL